MPLKNNNGSIRLYFTFNGHLYSMSKLGGWDDSIAKNTANQILAGIKNDIALGKFDCKNSDELFETYHPLAKLARQMTRDKLTTDCLELVQSAIAKKTLKDKILCQVILFMGQFGKPIRTSDDAKKFFDWLCKNPDRKPATINRYIDAIKPICPVFSGIPKLKASQPIADTPFSKDEISRILEVFNQYFDHYLPFIKFLFATGCRPNEATAMKWNYIDFQRKTITICEAIGFDSEGKKIKKGTKTGAVRTFPMSSQLLDALNQQHNATSPHPIDSLVFLTENNSIIDIRNFRSRVWTKALELAGVPYRRLYNTRHTFISHYLSEHKDFQKCAAITHGTKSGVQTLIKHYAHLVNDIETIDLW